jgi:hypothetical protein
MFALQVQGSPTAPATQVLGEQVAPDPVPPESLSSRFTPRNAPTPTVLAPTTVAIPRHADPPPAAPLRASDAGDVGEAGEVGDGGEAAEDAFAPLGRARSTSPLKPVDDETTP